MTDLDSKQQSTDLDSKQQSEVTAVEDAGQPAVSERKLQANQNNAKKSTGPKTARGKAISRYNALKHGLTALSVILADGKVNEDLVVLIESLREKYGRHDVVTELLLENLLADYWRNAKGLRLEIDFMKHEGCFTFRSMPALQRYITTNRRAFLRNLELLHKMSYQSSQDEEAEVEVGPCEAQVPVESDSQDAEPKPSTGDEGEPTT